MAVKDFDTFEESMIRMFKSLSAAHPEFAEDILALYPPEILLRGLSTEDLLRGLSTEDRLRGLSAEDLLRGLSAEEVEQLKRLLH